MAVLRVTSVLIFGIVIQRIQVPVSTVTLNEHAVEVQDNTRINITCKTNAGRPNARIQWYLSDGTNLTELATQEPNCNMPCNDKVNSTSELSYVGKMDDNGKEIYCNASNVKGMAVTSNAETIVILHGPSAVVLFPSNTSYTVTENAGGRVGPINCTAACRPDCTYTWSGPSKLDSMSVLFLQNINRTQAGQYRCTAKNKFGKNDTDEITVTINYKANDVMLSPPDMSYTKTENESLGPISCKADCWPNCTMIWSGPNLPVATISILNVHNINRDQAGDYRCTASNIVGNHTSDAVSVFVNYGPQSLVVSPSIQSYTVTENNGTVGPINCIADCRPNCTMTWSGPNLPGGTTSALYLPTINRNQTGKYRCTASNIVGNLTSVMVSIVVHYGPIAIILSPSDPSYAISETIGRVGPINCTADCRPKCTMAWSGPNLPGGTTSVLYIKNITRNQSGEYSCRANNIFGSLVSDSVSVIVNYGPSFVSLYPSTSSYILTEKTGNVGPITCTADCRPNCTMTWEGPNLPVGTTSVLNLQNVSRIQAGGYRCIAKNSIGNVSSAVVKLLVK